MPRLKYMEVPKASLHGIPIQAGQIIHCLDSEELFYDNSNTIRIQSTNIIPIDSLSSVPSPEHNKLYIDRHKYIDDYGREVYQGPEYATLYKYNDKAYWQQVNETSEVNSFLSSYTELVPSILSEDGQNRAPATMASVVFTDSGDNLEDLVKEIKVLKVNQEEIEVEYNNQTDFLTHPPYDGYFKYPNRNFWLINIDGVMVPKSQYQVKDGNIIAFPTKKLTVDNKVNVTYIFQADLNSSDTRTAGYTDGGYILDGSIPTSKLSQVTNSYHENTENKIPTAKAVNDAFNNLLTKLNNLDMSTRIYAADSSSNNYELVLFIKHYVPTDMNTIILRTKYDIGSDSWVRINDNEPVPLYKDIDTPIKQGDIKAGNIIQIRYNALQNIFYLINPDMYKVIKDVSRFSIDGQQYVGPLVEIPINLDNYVPGIDQVDVYYENIKLFEGLNFHFKGNSIVLDGFYANTGETFIFERTRCIASNL